MADSPPATKPRRRVRIPDAAPDLSLDRHEDHAEMVLSGRGNSMDAADVKAPQHYINRELSFLEFNQRVLAQAFDESIPLLERMRFLCISSSNLDEFFEIRVAGLKQLLELGSGQFATDTLSLREQL